jgi:hypothetical protein
MSATGATERGIFPAFFPVCREFGREEFAQDYILQMDVRIS